MDIRNVLIIFHVIGTAIGVGAATVSDYLFFSFARDGKINRREFATLTTVSHLVWIGLLIILLSAFGFVLLYLSGHEEAQAVYSMDKMWAKLTIVIVLLCNGFFIHRRVLPLLKANKKSKIIFVSGAISIISWYSSLILGAWRHFTASYMEIMAWYVIVICIGIAISIALSKRIMK